MTRQLRIIMLHLPPNSPRARLLTVAGYGHTALLNPSTCAGGYETSYFLTGENRGYDRNAWIGHHA